MADFERLCDLVNSCAYDIVAGGDVTKVNEMRDCLRELVASDVGVVLVAGLLVFIGDEQYNKALVLANDIKEK